MTSSGKDDGAVVAPIMLVTGGSGYIGRNLIRRFVADGRAVHALARSEASAAAVSARGTVAKSGDMLGAPSLVQAMKDCDQLVHAAADTRHGAYEAGQDKANLQGTHNVFAAARSAGISARYILARKRCV
jgi:nucleoside-diphosphate-sugar epimerase